MRTHLDMDLLSAAAAVDAVSPINCALVRHPRHHLPLTPVNPLPNRWTARKEKKLYNSSMKRLSSQLKSDYLARS